MKELLVVFTLVCIYAVTTVQSYCDVEGYYWRDFYGNVSKDGFPGGSDTSGHPVYISQVYGKFLIPAKLYSNDKKAYYEYGGKEHAVTANIKVLCTQHPTNFEWIQTSNDDIKLLTEKHLVIGGYEPGCTTYIGRARYGGEVLVGKALADTPNAGLYITKDGKTMKYTSFEVLAFNPNRPNIDTRFNEK